MVLGDKKIRREIERGNIVIQPYNPDKVGSNSYDVHLGKTLATYSDSELDAKRPNALDFFDIPDDGYVLRPGVLYLGNTVEYTESKKHLVWIDGKSSIGRLGIQIHLTAGRSDVGFCGHFTLEIAVIMPVRIYSGMPIGQLTFMETTKVVRPYNIKRGAKYNNTENRPIPSMMWKNFK